MATIKEENSIADAMNNIADAITYLAEQFNDTNERNMYSAVQNVSRSLWDGLRADGTDETIPDSVFSIAIQLNKLVKAIEQSK